MVITITDGVMEIRSDDRFRRWAKRVRAQDVDLSQSGGHALGGQWLTWGKAAALEEGDYLVLAAETGSRANHSYQYRLGVVRDGQLVRIGREEREQALASANMTDAQRAAAANSTLYAYACYIALAGQAPSDTAAAVTGPDLTGVPTEALLAELRRRGVALAPTTKG